MKKRLWEVLCVAFDVASERTHSLCKVLFGYHGFVAHTEAVVINRLCGAVEKFGYLDAVGYAETNESIDAELGVE